jgi:hypothetical protein
MTRLHLANPIILLALASLLATPAAAQVNRPVDPDEPARRAADSTRRLEATEAGKLVLRSVNYHGGYEKWFGGRALRFRYDYKPLGEMPRRNSLQVIDLLASRAYHDMDAPAKGRFAWTGEQAWAEFPEPEKAAVRFWALTPYYFVAMPFVLGDPGVKLEQAAEDPAAAGLPAADTVKVTFESGTGDAPDDYYIVYLAKDTGRLLALRYVVSYAPFMKPGMKHTPEKLLVYEGETAVGPLKLAARNDFYAWTGKRGDKITVSTVSEWQYGATFDASRLKAPAGAHVDRSMDGK